MGIYIILFIAPILKIEIKILLEIEIKIKINIENRKWEWDNGVEESKDKRENRNKNKSKRENKNKEESESVENIVYKCESGGVARNDRNYFGKKDTPAALFAVLVFAVGNLK